jgi:hypothetical protein
MKWSRRQESNLYLALRRHSFYPLNYGEERGIVGAIPFLLQYDMSLPLLAVPKHCLRCAYSRVEWEMESVVGQREDQVYRALVATLGP